MRRYEIIHDFFKEREQHSIDRTIGEDDKEYVLLGLTMEECKPALDLPNKLVAISGWANLLSHAVPMPNFGSQATSQEWVSWARVNDRRLRAAVLEWVLIDPSRGEKFIKKVANSPEFRKAFSGYFTSTAAVMVRLGAPEPKPLLFFWDNEEQAQVDQNQRP